MSYLNREIQAMPSTNLAQNVNRTMAHSKINDEYLSISNDWDLDAAFIYSSHPYLNLNIIVSSDFMFKFDEEQKVGEQSANEDWDVISNLDLKPISPNAKSKQLKSMDASGNS